MNERTVDERYLSVEYWRERFAALLPPLLEKYETLMGVAEVLGDHDDEFKGTRGFFRFQNVKINKGGKAITRKAVQIMEKLTPKKQPAPRLSRQKIAIV